MYTITSEDVAKGTPAMVQPLEVTFSPDGSCIYFLYPSDSKGTRQLHFIDLKSVEPKVELLVDIGSAQRSLQSLTLQEQLRRERMRLFTSGVTSYQWDISRPTKGKQRILIPLNGSIIMYDESIENPHERLLFIYEGESGSAIDPKLSPDGKKIGFVIEKDLYCLYLEENNKIIQLTTAGEQDGVSCGLSDFVAQEEMKRFDGFWWSPKSDFIAFTQNDESIVPEFRVAHSGDSDPHKEEIHRYPFAGKTNPLVKVFSLRIPSNSCEYIVDSAIMLPLFDDESRKSWENDYYVPRVNWFPDNSVLVQVQNRSQNELHVVKISTNGDSSTLIKESSKSWINLHDMMYFLPNDNSDNFSFLWASERFGFSNLFLYSYTDGKFVCKTEKGIGGNWVIDNISGIDVAAGCVYVMGNKDKPTEKHLYRLSYTDEDKEAVRITKAPGFHSSFAHSKLGFYLDIHSSLENPPIVLLEKLPDVSSNTYGDTVAQLLMASSLDSERYSRLSPVMNIPQIKSIFTKDNNTELFYSLQFPPNYNFNTPLPTILSVYGGPSLQRVNNQWTTRASLRDQLLCQQGYLVVRIDNRGSDRRGLSFESALYLDMGNIEVQDYCAVVDQLVSDGLTDKSRVGIYGWSYGGYITLMSLARAPHVFRCGVSGVSLSLI